MKSTTPTRDQNIPSGIEAGYNPVTVAAMLPISLSGTPGPAAERARLPPGHFRWGLVPPPPRQPARPFLSAPRSYGVCPAHHSSLHGALRGAQAACTYHSLLPLAGSPVCAWCTCLPRSFVECTSPGCRANSPVSDSPREDWPVSESNRRKK